MFNRLDNHIHQLQGKIAILTGSLLTTLSVLITIFIYSSENGKLLYIDYLFGGLSFVFLIIAFFIAYNIFFPKESYYELILIEDFEDLKELSEEDLYSDILYYLKKSYEHNLEEYGTRIKKLRWDTLLYVIAVIFLIVLLFTHLVII